ncbi:uncharacterized protein SPAPADRAFT_63301 [Spathaspora passalidarum NRRL Y-27907]|uniref:Uncharacterized protein n=1 Tax=Spathaspora passalidarum (strain NRRL Y-27907 / 11-Y1) TaxID=619300 RepID=G3AUA2_SPAPN|nr:uncharacterized protein SPAPADRAFT_63301 [Spathaspora passalidarum NRRL Y-27907]EGW30478.1 hypothetical protein SPAPADRAFT_63301 [Spathaspora passalidarum NRRL Y-27907]
MEVEHPLYEDNTMTNEIPATSTSTTTLTNHAKLNKTPLKKEELEKIARELKKKLSKASITAKQSLSPTNIRTTPQSKLNRSSPLKKIMSSTTKEISPIRENFPSSSPITYNSLNNSTVSNLYSPTGRSPTHIKTPAAMYLASSPLKHTNGDAIGLDDSPLKRRKKSSPSVKMVLQEISPKEASIQHALKPSLDMTNNKEDAEQTGNPGTTTPTLSKQELYNGLKTPTQRHQMLSRNGTDAVSHQQQQQQHQQQQQGQQGQHPQQPGAYNDAEGADLLMYLATSPSPAKPYFQSNALSTPRTSMQRQVQPTQPPQFLAPLPPASAASTISNSSTAPPPPVTPKRTANINRDTPSSRLTPGGFLSAMSGGQGLGLPSQGLTLTPTGFNMNDYVNFFTPSPGSAAARNLLRTPDFNNLINGGNGTPGMRGKIEGKMLNFNKVLFRDKE